MSTSKNPQRILVVDDDGAVLSLLKTILESGGYSVTAASGAEAAARCHSENSDVDLLVTDVEMFGKTGIELAAELSMKQPDLPVLFVTGAGTPARPQNGPPPNVLFKPFHVGALLASVKQILATS